MDHDIRDPAPAPTTAPEPTENTPQKRKRIAQEQLERVRQENEAIEAEEELAQEERKKRAAAERLAVLVDKGDAYGNPERPSTPPPRPPVETRSPALPAGWSRVRSRPVPVKNVNYPRAPNSRRSGLVGPHTTPPIVNYKYMTSTL